MFPIPNYKIKQASKPDRYFAAFILLFADLINFGGTIPPQLNVASQDVRVRSGQTAVLTCVVDYLGSHQVTWHRGQNVVLAVDEKLIYNDRRMSVGRPSIRTWELRIQNATRRDAGDYFCVINSRDMPSGKITLAVEEAARIVSAPQPVVTVDEFETFKLICNATGYPRPRVEWFRVNDQEELKISENYGEILLFINVTRDCFGRYRCRASNGVGKSEHRDTDVSVIARPIVAVDPENVGRERGSKVTVDCSISGHPISWAGWFLRGELLTNGGKQPAAPPIRQKTSGITARSGDGDAAESTSSRHRIEWLGRSSAYRAVLRLTIDPLMNDADFGSYTCAATDGRSFTTNASFYLWEKSPMPPVDSDGSAGDTTTTGWRPSIVIDSGPPNADEYTVASPETGSSDSQRPKPPKIVDEGMPTGTRPAEAPSEFSSEPGDPLENEKIADERPAEAEQRRGGSPCSGTPSLFLVAGLLVAAAVFQVRLSGMSEYSDKSSPCATSTFSSSQTSSRPSLTKQSVSSSLRCSLQASS